MQFKPLVSLFLVLALFAASFSFLPVHADELDALQAVGAYENEFRQGMIAVDRAAVDAVNDSNLPTQDKNDILAVLAIQELALRTMANIYGFPIDPILPDSDTVFFSGSGGVGLYKISGYNDVRLATLYSYDNAVYTEGKIPLVTSSDFEIYFDLSETSNYSCSASVTSPYYNFSCSGNWWSISIASTNSVGFSNLNSWGATSGRYYIPSSIPVLTSIPGVASNDNNSICGNVVVEELPFGSCPTVSPWDYYNNYVLPDIQNNYSSVTNNYIVFPNGYTPSVPVTDPPLFPYTEPWFNPDFIYQQTETSISVVNPTATNDSCTTYTETTIVELPVTDTTTTYVPVYGFNVPLLPDIQTVIATIPHETVDSNTVQNIGNIWSFIKWVLDSSGLFPLFLAFASIGFVLYILHMLGG